ncbi:hypothetical protein ACFL2V_17160 [Pseudomonadota bacterium]
MESIKHLNPDSDLNQASDIGDIEERYKTLQTGKRQEIKHPKTMSGDDTGVISDEKSHDIIKSGSDYGIVRLAALLNKGTLAKDYNRFTSVLNWLSPGELNQGELKYKYFVICQTPLVDDLKITFGENSLKYHYIIDVLNNGASSYPARFALELGLLKKEDETISFATLDKKRVLKIIKSAPGEFKPLLDKDTPGNIFLQAAHGYIQKTLAGATTLTPGLTGFFQELKALLGLRLSQENPKNDETDDTEKTSKFKSPYRKTGNANVDYLTSLVRNFSVPISRVIDKNELTEKIKDWAHSAGEAERKKFTLGFNDESNVYNNFWFLFRRTYSGDTITPARIERIKKTVEIIDLKTEEINTKSIASLEVMLEKYKSHAIQFTTNTSLKHKALEVFSFSDDWRPQKALAQYYNTNGNWKKAFSILENKFIDAGLKERQINEIKTQITLKACYGGGEDVDDFRKIPIYQKLTKTDLNPIEAIELLVTVARDSLDYQTIRRDKNLLQKIKSIIISTYIKIHSAEELLTTPVVTGEESANKYWSTITHILSLPDQRIDARHELGLEPTECTPQTASPEPNKEIDKNKYWAGIFLATYKTNQDIHAALRSAFKAQNEGMSGKNVGRSLKAANSNAFTWMIESKFHNTQGVNSAHKRMSEFFNSDKKIEVLDLLHAARAHTHLGAETKTIDFTVEEISSNDALEMWASKALEELNELTEKRFRLEMKLWASPKGPDADKNKNDINQVNQGISKFRIGINEELDKKLREVTDEGKVTEIKKQVELKIAEALSKGSGKSASLVMTTEERRGKASEVTSGVDIKQQAYLESGAKWHGFSTAGTRASAGMGSMLDKMWETQHELSPMSSSLESAPHKAEAEKLKRTQLLDQLEAKHDDLSDSQKVWKETQDKFNKRAKQIVAAIVEMIFIAAGLFTGIGAAPGVVQIIWALGQSLIESAIDQSLSYNLSRTGDKTAAKTGKEVVTKLTGDMAGATLVAEAALAIDLLGMDVHDTDSNAKMIFGKPALAVVKQQIKSVVSDSVEGASNQFFKQHPISSLIPDIKAALIERVKGLPPQACITYLKAMGGEVCRVTSKSAAEKTGHKDLAWTPTSSPKAQGYTQDNKDENQDHLFSSDGINSWAIYQGGPSHSMGADNWMGDRDESNAFMVVKTMFYEQLIIKKIGEFVDFGADNLRPHEIDEKIDMDRAVPPLTTKAQARDPVTAEKKPAHKAPFVPGGPPRRQGRVQ